MSDLAYSALHVSNDNGLARVVLDRPERHNAFDDHVINELDQVFTNIAQNQSIRAVILSANGKSFSAGADIEWMKRAAAYTEQENEAASLEMAKMLNRIYTLPQPVIALVQGGAYGGGVGLVAVSDVVVATTQARFCFSEVKLGIIPAVISPYVVRAAGSRALRRYFFTADVFDADEAFRLGLVDIVTDGEELESTGLSIAAKIMENGPAAVAASKQLIDRVSGKPIDESLVTETAKLNAKMRATDEGRDGIAAFLEKRPPVWRKS
ncbi:MAG: enoyl-CoA hydratase-related protein [Rhodospirillaceae bacterium]|jgi:methylglutaconyl-CoA hydratase